MKQGVYQQHCPLLVVYTDVRQVWLMGHMLRGTVRCGVTCAEGSLYAMAVKAALDASGRTGHRRGVGAELSQMGN